MNIMKKIKRAFNVFSDSSPSQNINSFSSSSITPLHRPRRAGHFNKSQFVSSAFNRIALDVATTKFSFVRVNEDNGDEEPQLTSGLNRILTEEANLDQTAFNFIHDIVYSMMDEGVVAVVPIDVFYDPKRRGGYDIETMRVGRIVQWLPQHIRVDLYNDRTGNHEEVLVPKDRTAIIENPLMSIVGKENSTLSRLIRKLSMVDNMDEIISSGRLDVLIQLPYALRNESRLNSAKERISNIASDLASGKNGIAYIDSTEKVIQLNRPANTQVVENAKMLQDEFYNQLGLTENVMNGTASEQAMRLYYARSIDPIIVSIVQEFNRKFVTKKMRSDGYRIVYRRETFALTPVETIAMLSDTLKRNSVLTSNEVRTLMGFRPHNDPEADRLTNPNMPESEKAAGTQQLPDPNQNEKNIAEKKGEE